jgi:predicted  nucleic acid-binding Zn-ribbon protein
VNKVKKEFFLSLIFIYKWLALSLGVVGVLYAAISLAYYQTYYNPEIKKYELEISRYKENISSLEKDQNKLSKERDVLTKKMDKHLAHQSNINNRGKKTQRKISNICKERMWSNPFPKQSKECAIEVSKFEELKKSYKKIESKVENLKDKVTSVNSSLLDISEKIKEDKEKIKEVKRDIEDFKVGSTRILLWLAALLGLT